MGVDGYEFGAAYRVIKLGGSVLRSLDGYRRCAHALRRRLAESANTRLIVVVSARYGKTDRLARLADSVHAAADAGTRDLLWSVGETYSVAVLTLALGELGVSAKGLGVHECGVRVDERGCVSCDVSAIRRAAVDAPVVVLPGFFGLNPAGRIESLGRGGSDLSAVVLAAALGADTCELIKDVGGYFTADPRAGGCAEAIQDLGYRDALNLADAGCPVVQREALVRAAKDGIVLRVGGLDADAVGTVVGEEAQASLVA